MAQYYWGQNSYPATTQRIARSGDSYASMVVTKGTTSGTFFRSVNILNNISDIETYAKFSIQDSTSGVYQGQYGILYNRFSGTDEASTNGFCLKFIQVSGVKSIMISDEASNGGAIAWTAYDWSVNTTYCVRFSTIGQDCKAKIWPSGTQEPTSWFIGGTSTKTISNPFNGVGTYVKAHTIGYSVYAAGTAGDSAPAGQLIDPGVPTIAKNMVQFPMLQWDSNLQSPVALFYVNGNAVSYTQKEGFAPYPITQDSIITVKASSGYEIQSGKPTSWAAPWKKTEFVNIGVSNPTINKDSTIDFNLYGHGDATIPRVLINTAKDITSLPMIYDLPSGGWGDPYHMTPNLTDLHVGQRYYIQIYDKILDVPISGVATFIISNDRINVTQGTITSIKPWKININGFVKPKISIRRGSSWVIIQDKQLEPFILGQSQLDGPDIIQV